MLHDSRFQPGSLEVLGSVKDMKNKYLLYSISLLFDARAAFFISSPSYLKQTIFQQASAAVDISHQGEMNVTWMMEQSQTVVVEITTMTPWRGGGRS